VLLGSKFRLNTTTPHRQAEPQLCLLKDGSFVAVWNDANVPTYGYGKSIRGQFLNADGTKRGKDFLVSNSNGDLDQYSALVTVLSDGRFVVAWNAQPVGPTEVWARVFQSNGTPIGRQFVVDTNGLYPSLTSLSDGGFAIAYYKDHDVKAQGFGPSLTRIGDETTVNTSTMKAQPPRSLVILQYKYMVFFADYTDKHRIIGRIPNNDGSTPSSATDFVIVADGGMGFDPVATKLSDGRIVVA
jgi:hypothetical protein